MSHKFRLAVWASGIAALVFAVLFVAAWLFAYGRIVQIKKSELTEASQGLVSPREEFDPAEFKEAHPTLRATLFGSDGAVLASTGGVAPKAVEGLNQDGNELNVGLRRANDLVVVSAPWKDSRDALRQLGIVLATLWLPLSITIGFATFLGARSVFQPLERMTREVTEASGSELDARLETSDPAEFGDFARQMNKLLSRIEETARREEQFASDAAHELRTPLTILRARIETTLLRSRSEAEYIESHRELLQEIERLSVLVDALLTSARSNGGEVPVLDLLPAVKEICDRWQPSFLEHGRRLALSGSDARAKITAEELGIALDNLLSNAVRFAPEDSAVTVKIAKMAGISRIEVCDLGPGIPKELRERIFDRFVRGDQSRSRKSGGVGIGLAVCRRLIQARGGLIHVGPGEVGATLVIELPDPEGHA